MSNPLNIEVRESRIAGSTEAFEYSIIATDSYGTAVSDHYESLDALLMSYPNRLNVLEWIENKPEFDGAFTIDNSKVIYISISSIDFSGYPEDDSVVQASLNFIREKA
jgi:hypothetical protein